MSFPKLNLKKHFCDRFVIELSASLNKEAYAALTKADILDNFQRDAFNLLTETYKIGSKNHTLIYLFHCCKEGKSNTMHLLTSFEYRLVTANLAEKTGFKISFPKMFAFFNKHVTDFAGRAISRFIFPLDKFEPIMQLPYSWGGSIADKRIEIRGLDLSVESKAQKYRQAISVEEKSIVEGVGILDIQDQLSVSLIKNTFGSMVTFAQELVRKKKGARGAVSK